MDGSYYISQEESNRIQILRFAAIVLVVYIHMSDSNLTVGGVLVQDVPLKMKYIQYWVAQILARSSVPVFFLISSVLLYQKEFTWKKNMKKKLKSIVFPFFFWNTIWLFLFLFCQSIPQLSFAFSNLDNSVKDFGLLQWVDAYLAVFERERPFLYPLWFLKDLFVLNIFAVIIRKVMDKIPHLYLAVVFLIWLCGIEIPIIETQSLFFFACGYYVVKYKITMSQIDKYDIRWLSTIYVGLSLLLCSIELFVMPILVLHNLLIAFGVIHMIAVSKYLYSPSAKGFWTVAVKNTFFIYAFHEWNLMFLRKITAKILPQTGIIQLLEFVCIPIVVIGVSIFVAQLLKGVCPKVYDAVTGSR